MPPAAATCHNNKRKKKITLCKMFINSEFVQDRDPQTLKAKRSEKGLLTPMDTYTHIYIYKTTKQTHFLSHPFFPPFPFRFYISPTRHPHTPPDYLVAVLLPLNFSNLGYSRGWNGCEKHTVSLAHVMKLHTPVTRTHSHTHTLVHSP